MVHITYIAYINIYTYIYIYIKYIVLKRIRSASSPVSRPPLHRTHRCGAFDGAEHPPLRRPIRLTGGASDSSERTDVQRETSPTITLKIIVFLNDWL